LQVARRWAEHARGALHRNPSDAKLQRQQKETTMNFDKEYDASGLACPLPIVKTKKALADMTSGTVLKVMATDPGSVCDMAAFAEQTGNALLQQGEEGGKYVFFLKKA
jgi:tRNA 2-thiouridine synthesizing protein A